MAQTASAGSRMIDAAQALNAGERQAIVTDSDTTDVSAGLQRIIDRIANDGGGGLFLPPGYYALTRPLRLPVGVDVIGAGTSTALRPRDCPAIELDGITGFARTRIENLRIQGTSTTNAVAIVQRSGASPDDELAGIAIDSVQIDHFATAIQLSTVRHASISRCWFRDVQTGIALIGKCLVVDVDGVAIVAAIDRPAGDGLVADGRRYSNGTIVRPETIRVKNLYAYGFRTGVRFEAIVHGVIEDCDISASRDGISWSSASGVINIRGGYVELLGKNAHAGAWGKDQSEPTGVLVNVSETCFLHAGSRNDAIGVLLGSPGGGGNQNNVSVARCTFSGFGVHDIAVHNSGDIDLLGNRCRSTMARASIMLSGIPRNHPIVADHNRCSRPIVHDREAIADGDLYLSRNTFPAAG